MLCLYKQGKKCLPVYIIQLCFRFRVVLDEIKLRSPGLKFTIPVKVSQHLSRQLEPNKNWKGAVN